MARLACVEARIILVRQRRQIAGPAEGQDDLTAMAMSRKLQGHGPIRKLIRDIRFVHGKDDTSILGYALPGASQVDTTVQSVSQADQIQRVIAFLQRRHARFSRIRMPPCWIRGRHRWARGVS